MQDICKLAQNEASQDEDPKNSSDKNVLKTDLNVESNAKNDENEPEGQSISGLEALRRNSRKLAGLGDEPGKKKKVKLGLFGGKDEEEAEDDGEGSTGSRKSFMSKIGPGVGRRKKRQKKRRDKDEGVEQIPNAVDLGTGSVFFWNSK
jgi:hypothetical protein